MSEVMEWLRSNGVEKSQITNKGDALQVKTTLGVASRLFYTQFKLFQNKETGKIRARQFGEYSVPAHLEHIIDMVAGLSEFPPKGQEVKRYKKMNVSHPEIFVSIVPQSLQQIYKIGNAKVTRTGASVGVIEFDQQYYAPSDLASFSQQFGVVIPPLASSRVVGFNDPTNPQIEATLDIQYALGVGVGASGWFWIEPGTTWLYGFATHLFSTTSVPQVNSISYGWNEEDQCEPGIGQSECQALGVNSTQYVARVNVEFQKDCITWCYSYFSVWRFWS